ncbi:MAG: SDR family NAD-dependent epimerase/dehydratase, partial [Candidatus Aenigmatarchaeota archaeon]
MILVTGGAGFIGSWLCESLLEKGYQVVCVDSLITGEKGNI